MASDDYECIHLVDTRFSRCGLCMDQAPRGTSFTEGVKQAVAGPERQAATWRPTWQGALDSVPRAGAAGDNDWADLASAAQAEQEAAFGRWIPSKYDGTCQGCGYRWEAGEMIRFSNDEQAWVCSECGSG